MIAFKKRKKALKRIWIDAAGSKIKSKLIDVSRPLAGYTKREAVQEWIVQMTKPCWSFNGLEISHDGYFS